ncbi:MAG TPA: hypothetical protein VNM90_05175, partial [Haliangium sp.]|nr:hypothetical protein [Haliangium sp.]
MLGGLSTAWGQAGDLAGAPAPAPGGNQGLGATEGAGGAGEVVEAAGAAEAAGAREPDPVAPWDRADSVMARPEPLMQKPSGFWTSGRPAVGGAYRYRLLGIGVGVLVITAIVMVWVVRRYPRRDPEGGHTLLPK